MIGLKNILIFKKINKMKIKINKNRLINKILLIFLIIIINTSTHSKKIGGDTGYEIPRYISLKSNEVNLRIGSSTNYPILLTYSNKNMPVEVIDEYGFWRKINDFEGNEGWIHKSLLQGDRYAIIQKYNNKKILIFSKSHGTAIGQIGLLNKVKVNTCLKSWCKINFNKHTGWIHKNFLWGIYDNELINIPSHQKLINIYWEIF